MYILTKKHGFALPTNDKNDESDQNNDFCKSGIHIIPRIINYYPEELNKIPYYIHPGGDYHNVGWTNYSGYLKRQSHDIAAFNKDESVLIPDNINFGGSD